MTMGKTHIASLLVAAVLCLSYSALAAPCAQPGKYCINDAAFECVDGQGVLIEQCKYMCSDGVCTQAPLEPSVGVPEAKPQAAALGNEYILYTIVAIIALTAVLLLVRLRRRK